MSSPGLTGYNHDMGAYWYYFIQECMLQKWRPPHTYRRILPLIVAKFCVAPIDCRNLIKKEVSFVVFTSTVVMLSITHTHTHNSWCALFTTNTSSPKTQNYCLLYQALTLSGLQVYVCITLGVQCAIHNLHMERKRQRSCVCVSMLPIFNHCHTITNRCGTTG